MKLTFDQGLARYQTDIYAIPTFLQKSSQTGEFIDLIVSPDPTIIVFAHKNATYVVEETKTVPHAWGPFPGGSTKYLYWDLNLLDGALTRGFTLYPQVISGTAPVNPAVDQHWFDTAQRQLKVWNGSKWVDKVRVFAGTYSSNAIIQPAPLGSQANLVGEFNGGSLILDSFNKPLRQADGTFVTSASELAIIDAGTTKVRLGAEIVNGAAGEYIPKFSLVQARPGRRFILARSDDWRTRIIGLVTEDLHNTEVGAVTQNGLVRNEQWNWPEESIGRPIFCGVTGEVTLVPPVIGVCQVVGYVFDRDSVYLSIQAPIILDDVTQEASPTPPPLNPPPLADFAATPLVGTAPLAVHFTSLALHNPTAYDWDFENDGVTDSTAASPWHIFNLPGKYDVRLRVSNQHGQDDELKLSYITVNAPVSSNQNTNLDIQLSGPLQVAVGERFTLSITVSNAGLRTATSVTRAITVNDVGNLTPALSNLPTGSTTTRSGNATLVSLPVLASLATGGFATSSFSITAPTSDGSIKVVGEVLSPEQDVTRSDNVAELSIKVK